MYSIRALVGDRSPGKEKPPRNGSWRKWFMTKIYNFIDLPNIFSKIHLEFLFRFDQLPFFFFFLANTTHLEVSHRENDYVEKISGINVEWSYVNKACQFGMISPGFIHTQTQWFLSSKMEWKQTALPSVNTFPGPRDLCVLFLQKYRAKPSVGLHFKLDS